MIDTDPRLRIVVVGSGPSGCYSAQSLRRAYPTAEICVLDALRTPYGLIRYGVAADHQGTKAIVRQFARQFERDDVTFIGGVEVGKHVSLNQLRDAFDIVVLAHGLHGDVALDTPGARDAAVIGAGRITRLLNGHPEEPLPAPSLGSTLAVVGHGNVAMDIARLLLKRDEELEGSDIDDEAHRALAKDLSVVHLIGRSTPENAKFDLKTASEVLNLPNTEHVFHGLDDDRETLASPKTALFAASPRVEQPRATVHWWFETTLDRIDRTSNRHSIILRTGVDRGSTSITVDSVISAIGFAADERQRMCDVHDEARSRGRIERGLYLAGWARRGPRGTIPDQRADARALAEVIMEDFSSPEGRPGTAALSSELAEASDYAAWLEIDDRERQEASPGRVRRKRITG